MTFQWKGVMPALTTKFTDNDELDFALFEKIWMHSWLPGLRALF
ncbi:hypothetical protein [Niabella hibiscisoli]|nr:hypothetical protein [Niabella hibiscisoli]